MPREPMEIARDVLEDVRAACERSGRPTEEAEVRRALDGLDDAELQAVRRAARSASGAAPLGPDALVDISRGTSPSVASAREASGYYQLKAERDVLASIARARGQQPDEPMPLENLPLPSARETTPPPAFEPEPVGPADTRPVEERRSELITLFAYHRDAVRVAQALGIGLSELYRRIDALGLKRRIHRLIESTDVEVFSPERVRSTGPASSPAPVVRKRGEPKPAAASPIETTPPPTERERPAAWTQPVNVHGTRVYRRTREEEPTPPPPAPGRREYVREPRRGVRPPPERPRREVQGPPPRRPFAELESTAGRVALERLLGTDKANPRVLVKRLSEQYQGPQGRELTEENLRSLLTRHELAEAFREKERANTFFLLGFHQGSRSKLAGALLRTPDELDAYLASLNLSEDLERLRADRRRQELARAKPGERFSQVLNKAAYLDDLGVLPVIDREAKDHLEAAIARHAREAGDQESLVQRLRDELSLEPNLVLKLMRRYGLGDAAGRDEG